MCDADVIIILFHNLLHGCCAAGKALREAEDSADQSGAVGEVCAAT
jgi:hypothetical protein